MKTIFSKAFPVVYALGKLPMLWCAILAVVVGLMFGFAGVAEAKVPALKKGVVNTVSTITSLVGGVAGPVLRLDNTGTAEGATALDLLVEPNNSPLTVNPEAGTATNLSADELDNLDSTDFLRSDGKADDSDKLDNKDSSAFMPASVYRKSETAQDTCTPGPVSCPAPSKVVNCDLGDQAIGGGFSGIDIGTTINGSFPTGSTPTNVTGWRVNWQDDSTDSRDSFAVYVVCANF